MPASISVTRPADQAWQRMVSMLFQPFNITRWFVVGFTAWLASLGSGGFSFSFDSFLPDGNSGFMEQQTDQPATPDVDHVDDQPDAIHTDEVPAWQQVITDWLSQVPVWGWYLLAAMLMVGLIAGVLLIWIRSRGRFMFIDNLAEHRAQVVHPWREYGREGNNLFKYELLLLIITFAMLVGVGVIAYFMFVEYWHAPIASPDAALIAKVLMVACLLIGVSLFYGLAHWVLIDLIVPIMYARRATVIEAWRLARADILNQHLASVLLYFLVKLGLIMAAAIAMVMFTCMTCCVTALPYIGTVILLPIHVFLQCYSLYFIDQFGDDYAMMLEYRAE